jgi:hypothetical protein
MISSSKVLLKGTQTEKTAPGCKTFGGADLTDGSPRPSAHALASSEKPRWYLWGYLSEVDLLKGNFPAHLMFQIKEAS